MSEVAKGKLSLWIVALATVAVVGLLGIVLRGMYMYPLPMDAFPPFPLF